MILNTFDYINCVSFTGDIERDVQALMAANGKEKTFVHMRSVAEVSVSLAGRFGLSEETCFLAAILHDVSAVIKPSDMFRYAKEQGMELCEAELRFPFLLHQRMSKLVSKQHFAVDNEHVLSAIECHTTLKKDADPYDMVLFIADKLSWDQEGTPPFYDVVSAALDASLEKACYTYMRYMEESGKLLCPHTNWNEARIWLQERI